MKRRYYQKRRKKESHHFYHFTMVVMALMVGVLLYQINVKAPFLTTETLSHLSLSNVSDLLFWKKLFPSEAVAANPTYHLLKDHYYSNGGNSVLSISDGVILETGKDFVLMLNDNGISVQYKKMKKVNVKADERVLKGSELGVMEDSVEIICSLDDEEISLEKAMAME